MTGTTHCAIGIYLTTGSEKKRLLVLVVSVVFLSNSAATSLASQGVSSASTIPATESQIAEFLGASTEETTPPAKAKTTKDGEKVSVPKHVKQESLGRSPTVRYSPEKPAKTTKTTRKGAVKDAPKDKASASKSKAKKPQDTIKAETTDATTSEAVRATLNRATTVDMKAAVEAAKSPEKDEEEKQENTSSSDTEENEEAEPEPEKPHAPEGVTLEQIRQRKAMHARYMRFSRSLSSTLAE